MKEEKFPHTRKALQWQRRGAGKSFGAMEESAGTGMQRAKRRDSAQRISAGQHSPAREACLLTCRDRWGLGAEARASEVRSQGEDWGWGREHSLKGASAPQLAGREFGKSLDMPNRQETIVLGCARRGIPFLSVHRRQSTA